MDMKLDYCSLVDTQVRQAQYGPPVHHESFSSASGSSASFGSYSPASEQTNSSDHRLGSMGSCDFEAGSSAGSFSGLPLVDQLDTPPPSATMSNFFSPLEMQQAQASMVAATVAPHMTSGYMSTSAFPQPPATPDRHSSISSHHSSPITPANMLSSYPSSVTTPDSASPHHHNMLCGTGSPEAFFTDMHQHHQRHQPMQQHHNMHQQQPAYHASSHGGMYRDQQSPSYNVMATPSPAHSMRIENSTSPTDFMFNGNGRVESPIRDYFGEKSGNLPLPPPSATLPSSIVKNELLERYSSPEETATANLARRYSTASSASSYASTTMAMHRQYSRMGDVRRNSEALQRISNRQYEYSPYANGSVSPTAGGHVVVRNGIRVSRVASGAFKCIVPGCPSRPFKRSEHLKRHVTTHHENKDTFPCEFCGRNFNRKDNWRSHLKLHTISRGKNARTDYFPKAVLVYNEEMRKVSKCRPRKEKSLHDE